MAASLFLNVSIDMLHPQIYETFLFRIDSHIHQALLQIKNRYMKIIPSFSVSQQL